MNPKSDYIERSNACLEEILLGDLDGECLDNERGKCSELSIDGDYVFCFYFLFVTLCPVLCLAL